MNTLFVLQSNGQHAGPFTTETLARAIVDGQIHRDAFIAPPGAPQWLHASQMPEVLAIVDAMVRARTPSMPPPPQALDFAPASVNPFAPAAPQALQASPAPQTPRPPQGSQPPLRPASVAPPAPQPLAPQSPPAPLVTATVAIAPAAPAPAAPGARPAPAPAPAVAPAPAPAAAAKAPVAPQAKPADDKPKAKPWPKWLSVAIFGGFAFLALTEVAVRVVTAPKAEVELQGAITGAPRK
jgi:hypothetical protein